MAKWENLNMPLRSRILLHSIRQEQSASEIIKALLRILKPKTKTLSNKSSSLSFKNKIDLLHDLDELTSIEYNHLVKFMEIRNQFIHNHECSSFVLLGQANPELTQYLKKNFPNDEDDEEVCLYKSYNSLFIYCQGTLLVKEREFIGGVRLDYEKYINNQLIRDIDGIISGAKEEWIENNLDSMFQFPPKPEQAFDNIDSFILYLRINISKRAKEIIDSTTGEEKVKEVFKRKISLEEIALQRKEEQEAKDEVAKRENLKSED